MSKRRKIGDTVRKTARGGFVKQSSIVIIPDVPENHEPGSCFMCDDEKCQEWPTVWVKGSENMDCHVSECEMEDLSDGE